MFEINDEFLSGVGYDVAALSEEQKQAYIAELSEEFSARLQRRFLGEIDEVQAEDFDRMQENVENSRAWLNEFHSDYRDRDDFQQLLKIMDTEDEAVMLYASELWIQDAVPTFHDIAQEELNAYYADLVDKRKQADELVEQLQ